MDELLQSLEQLSRDFTARLSDVNESEITQFLDLREQLIERMKQDEGKMSMNPGHLEAIRRISSYDEAILGRMNELKNEAAQQISRASKTRKQSKAYEMPYTADGVYIDKKK